MKKLLTVMFAALSIASFTGCKKKGGDSGAALAKYTEFKDKMCKCAESDMDCANKVNEDMKKWADSQPKPKEGAAEVKPDPKMAEVVTAMSECQTKAMKPKMGDMGSGAGSDMAGSGAAGSDMAGSAAGSADGSAAGSAAGSADGSAK